MMHATAACEELDEPLLPSLERQNVDKALRINRRSDGVISQCGCRLRPTFFALFVLLVVTLLSLGFYLKGELYLRRRVIPKWTLGLEKAKQFARQKPFSRFHSELFADTRSVSYEQIADGKITFDIESNDVIVFVHIQKTAGTTFERFITRHLDIEQPCECNKGVKRCLCYRPGSNRRNKGDVWLFSRFSTGWTCGVHADWTELAVSNCVENALDKKSTVSARRRYFYTTFLREPVERFISEYRHVKRGAVWIQSQFVCNGRRPTPEELPLCFDPDEGWDDVTLDDFLACPYNMAFNRQTRMLADLTLVHCYDRTAMPEEQRNQIMLESAKKTIRSMAWFGIQENMGASQELFEQLFHLQFSRSMDFEKRSKSNDTVVTDDQMTLIRNRNGLDLQLYDYAKEMFLERYRRLVEPTEKEQRVI